MNSLVLDTITIKNATVEEKCKIASVNNYKGVELRGNDIKEYLERNKKLEDLKTLIKEYNLSIPSFVPESEFYNWHYQFNEDLEEKLKALFEMCVFLNISQLIFPVMSTDGDIKKTTHNFKKLCDMANEQNLQICLEFIGHIPKVHTITIANEIVEKAGRDNGGILLDVFHFYRGGSTIADLRSVPDKNIFLIHINDAMEKPREDLIGSKHRVYPGEGIIPLSDLFQLFKEKKYTGPFVVEIFNEEYWNSDFNEVAKKAYQTSNILLENRNKMEEI